MTVSRRRTVTIAELRRALQNLALAAAPPSRLIRNAARRRVLNRAIGQAAEILNADVAPAACAQCLQRAAAEADDLAKAEPGYRRDLEG